MSATGQRGGGDRGAGSTPPFLTEVRYSLPEVLAELKIERAAAAFAMEKLEQAEINKLFKGKATRRGQRKS